MSFQYEKENQYFGAINAYIPEIIVINEQVDTLNSMKVFQEKNLINMPASRF